MKDAILFKRCLGLNDSDAQATQVTNPSYKSETPGATELTACTNLTTTPDGAIESVPALSTVLTHTLPVTEISADRRLLYTDGINTNEWDGAAVTRFPIVTGPMVHTPVDCRVSSGASVYKSRDGNLDMTLAAVGTNPNPDTSKDFYAMPAYSKAFIHNTRLYAINATDPRFLQYSESFHYDLWDRGNGFIGHANACVDAGSIPGCVLAMHPDGVTAYVGSGPGDFVKKFFPCKPITGTLFSGLISKNLEYVHVFLCSDGVYGIDKEGVLARLTGDRINNVGTLNDSYSSATIDNGKYLAFGNTVTVEYDFTTKAAMTRASQGIVSAAIWGNVAHYAAGATVSVHSGRSAEATSLTLPFSKLGAYGRKSIIDLFFTGRSDGPMTITATGLEGRSWSLTTPALGEAHTRRIKTPKGIIGNHISFTIATSSGAFRMEEFRATISPSQRTR